jgi:Zn-dependent protease with chaperone function
MNHLRKKQIIFSIFSLFGMAYFSSISNLDMSGFWRGELALIPLQILAIIYVTCLRWQS